MTGRRRLGLAAAGATLLAAAPLATIFESWTWLVDCLITVGLVAGAALLARARRTPLWAQALGMAAALVLALTALFPSGAELWSLLPTPETFARFAALTAEAGRDTRSYSVPVPDREGLLFLAVLGVGAVAIVVDLLTAGLRRPALAGLPMLAVYAVPVAIYVESVPIWAFASGAAGYLWLLVADNVDRVRRFGRRFAGNGRAVDAWAPSPLVATGGRLAVLAVAAAVLLPLAAPGLSGSLLSQLTQAEPPVGGTGDAAGGGRVNLFANLSGNLTQPEVQEWARVVTNESDPYYLRFGVADVVTEDGFGDRPPSGPPVTQGLPEPPTAGGANYRRYHAVVQVSEHFRMPFAPTYPTTTATSGLDSGWSYDPNMQVVFSQRSTVKDRRYEFDYVRATYDPKALRAAVPLPEYDPLRARFTEVPPDDVVIDTVDALIDDEDSDYDKVLAIYRSFSQQNGYRYSLQTGSGPGTAGSNIAAFLQSKAGFCQQYAAAMTWLVRQAGIPARVAFGFTRGDSRDGDAYVLTNRNLHAWTEVYFAGFGWIPFDATPAAAVSGSVRPQWAPDVDRAGPTPAPSAAGSAAPTADASVAAAAPTGSTSAGAEEVTPRSADVAAAAVDVPIGAIAAVAVGTLLLCLLAVPALRRTLLRRRRQAGVAAPIPGGPPPPGGPEPQATTEAARARASAHAAWDELVDTMIDFRVSVDPGETPRQVTRRLADAAALSGPALAAAALLGQAEERARYARQPPAVGDLTAGLGQVRRALAATANRRTRLRAAVLPPSVLLRWRSSVAETAGRWASAYGRRRDAASRWSPGRLLRTLLARSRRTAGTAIRRPDGTP
ncbi:MAG TPA: DUF3488 and transglutaminase-like domain-containing protein [Actinoplanes sp.]|nr:DUF3488 and transglutaminase-like domain-containing protein [Actinoplanes sp.]